MPTILVVEDHEPNAQLLVAAMEMRGYEVVWVDNGADGVAAADQLRPAVILMDLRMPVMDGWTAIAEIRRIPGLENTPIVVTSVEVMQDDRARAFDVGADAFFRKPFDIQELRDTIDEMVYSN